MLIIIQQNIIVITAVPVIVGIVIRVIARGDYLLILFDILGLYPLGLFQIRTHFLNLLLNCVY